MPLGFGTAGRLARRSGLPGRSLSLSGLRYGRTQGRAADIRYRCFQSLSLPSGGNSCSSMSSSVRGLSPWIDSSASSVSSAPARRRIDAAWLTACSLSVIAVHLPQLPVLIRAVVFLGIVVPLDHPSRVAHSSEGAGGDDASPVFLDYGDYAVSQGDSGHSPTFWLAQC